MVETSDNELMAGVKNGRLDDLDRLFARHYGRLYTFCYRLTGTRERAEDAVQDVFLRILAYRHTFKSGNNFSSWSMKIAQNASLKNLKSEGRYVPMPAQLEVVAQGPDLVELLESDQQTELLTRALARLPPPTRELIVMARFAESNYADIARHYGATEGTIKVRVFRALKLLRKEYLALAGRTE